MAFIEPKQYSENWAIDLHKNVNRMGEIRNGDVISQSIEMILATSPGERLFNPNFGSPLWSYLFENLDKNTALELMRECCKAIKRWEDRIYVIEDQASIIIYTDENAIRLSIPYIIRRSGLKAVWEKKIFGE